MQNRNSHLTFEIQCNWIHLIIICRRTARFEQILWSFLGNSRLYVYFVHCALFAHKPIQLKSDLIEFNVRFYEMRQKIGQNCFQFLQFGCETLKVWAFFLRSDGMFVVVLKCDCTHWINVYFGYEVIAISSLYWILPWNHAKYSNFTNFPNTENAEIMNGKHARNILRLLNSHSLDE